MIRLPPRSTRTDTLFPYTTLFRSVVQRWPRRVEDGGAAVVADVLVPVDAVEVAHPPHGALAEALEHIDVAGREARDAGVLVRDRPEDDLVEVGQPLLPVLRVLLVHEAAKSDERRVWKECVRTCRI